MVGSLLHVVYDIRCLDGALLGPWATQNGGQKLTAPTTDPSTLLEVARRSSITVRTAGVDLSLVPVISKRPRDVT